MDSAELPGPVVEAVSFPRSGGGVPEVTEVHYVAGRLTVALEFDDGARGSVEFEVVRGFRVLDEGDLLEFWNPGTRAEGWLWSVGEGGWLTQERLRDGFLSGTAKSPYSEFLVLGQNDCVSVFSAEAPKVALDLEGSRSKAG